MQHWTSNELARGADSAVVREYIAANSATYAGEYFESAGDRWVFMFTSDSDGHLAALQSRYPYPEQMTVRTVTHTMAALLSWTNQVAADTHRFRTLGIWINRAGPDIPSNSVMIFVRPINDRERTLLRESYPNAPIRFVEERGGFGGSRSVGSPPLVS